MCCCVNAAGRKVDLWNNQKAPKCHRMNMSIVYRVRHEHDLKWSCYKGLIKHLFNVWHELCLARLLSNVLIHQRKWLWLCICYVITFYATELLNSQIWSDFFFFFTITAALTIVLEHIKSMFIIMRYININADLFDGHSTVDIKNVISLNKERPLIVKLLFHLDTALWLRIVCWMLDLI